MNFFLTAQARKMASFLLIDLTRARFTLELKAAHQTSQNVVHFDRTFHGKALVTKQEEGSYGLNVSIK